LQQNRRDSDQEVSKGQKSMTPQNVDIDAHLAKIRALIPAGQDAKSYLRQSLDAQIEVASGDTPMGVVPASLLSPTRVYASARITVELLDAPDRIADRPEGIVDLGVIEWLLRPTIQIIDGLIAPPTGPPWNNLDRGVVASASGAVCRLDLVYNGYKPCQVGTGFLIGQSDDGFLTVMTNAHVVQGFQNYGWPTVTGLAAVCDFQRYSPQVGGKLLPLMNEYRLHPSYDLALVFLDPDVQEITPPTMALTASSQAPDPTEGLKIGVIGHPSFNSAYDPFPKQFGFGDVFGVKRFSPGLIRALEERSWSGHDLQVVLHDSTTLSGSSGSCILDLESMNVVGLHFGGWPLPTSKVTTPSGDVVAQLFEANGAVPLWLLANDPMLRNCVSFR
jgi:hypothetical protein